MLSVDLGNTASVKGVIALFASILFAILDTIRVFYFIKRYTFRVFDCLIYPLFDLIFQVFAIFDDFLNTYRVIY